METAGARVSVLQAPAWETSVVHGFCGRGGGGTFGTFNYSYDVGDDPGRVATNWQRWRTQLADGADTVDVARMRQVHGRQVRLADEDHLDLGEVDGAISAAPGVVLTVLTADCVPVLLRSRKGTAVAAVHAGWRGTVADVVGATLRAMAAEFGVRAEDVEAALGPSIGPCCYEVGAEVIAEFRAMSSEMAAAAGIAGGSSAATHLDLRAANRALLIERGVPAERVVDVGPCTRCAADRFFSHRAAAGRPTGRQLSFIAITCRKVGTPRSLC